MEGAIWRYRIFAYIVGVLLVLLTIGMVLKYLPPKEAALVSVVAPIHGLLYMVYLVTAFDVWRRAGWPLSRMVAIVLAGVVPLMTFVIERRVVRDAQATLEDAPAPAV